MQTQDPQLTQERITRFKSLGGVELARLEPEERDPLLALVHTGTFELKKAVFTFRCDLCRNVVRNPTEMEPMCTGPSWLNEHPPVVMTKIEY